MKHQQNTGLEVPDSLRETTDWWLVFFKDDETGTVSASGYRHNPIADYRNNRYFIGMKKISVDMGGLEK